MHEVNFKSVDDALFYFILARTRSLTYQQLDPDVDHLNVPNIN
ncbi:hypothetical protein VCHA40O235_40207 [Vibrio chagasii]|nr:hypothetical protein VCHA40O235_40207 [Vibrio chagasii]CAH7370635.1 hypothetical protein VCHA37P199_70062 [Vibrio chagasii]